MNGWETRELAVTATSVRPAARGAGTWVGGIAVPWAPAQSRNLGGFVEQFAPTAFDLQQQSDNFGLVTGDYQHSATVVLGSVRAGTMTVTTARDGLAYSILLPQSLAYVRELVDRGDIGGASIQFKAITDNWQIDGERNLRTVTDAYLGAISLVAVPAYEATSARVMAGPLRMLPLAALEARAGRILSAKNLAIVNGVASSLRDLIDTALTDTPADTESLNGISRQALEAAHAQLRDLIDVAQDAGGLESDVIPGGDDDEGYDLTRSLRRRARPRVGTLRIADAERQLAAREAGYREQALRERALRDRLDRARLESVR